MTPSAALGGVFSTSVAFVMAPTIVIPSADIPYVAVLGCLVIPIAFACFVTAPRYIPAPELKVPPESPRLKIFPRRLDVHVASALPLVTRACERGLPRCALVWR